MIIYQGWIDIWGPWNAFVEQRYSNNCKTRWTRIWRNGYLESRVTIQRKINGVTSVKEAYPYSAGTYHTAGTNYTDMLYCPRNTCSAQSTGTAKGYPTLTTNWFW